MKVTLDSTQTTYNVRWQYSIDYHTPHSKPTTITDCFIEVPMKDSEPLVISIGTSHQGEKDIYDKEIGRRLALTRAVKAFILKSQRAAFWEAYRTMTKKPRWEKKS